MARGSRSAGRAGVAALGWSWAGLPATTATATARNRWGGRRVSAAGAERGALASLERALAARAWGRVGRQARSLALEEDLNCLTARPGEAGLEQLRLAERAAIPVSAGERDHGHEIGRAV